MKEDGTAMPCPNGEHEASIKMRTRGMILCLPPDASFIFPPVSQAGMDDDAAPSVRRLDQRAFDLV